MPRFTARRITVGTAAVAVGTAAPGITRQITFANHGSGEVAIGDSNLTWANGFRLGKGGIPYTLTITDGDIVYAIIGTGTQDLDLWDFAADL
jgi:hypothetical protein